MSPIRTALCTLAALALLGAGAAFAQTVAITGGKVITNTAQGQIENGVVLIRSGKILAVGGPDTAIPAGAKRLDASGKWVTPGLFAPFSRVGLVEVQLEDSTNDVSAGKAKMSAALDAADGFNPKAEAIAITKIEGMTRIGVAPDAGATIFAGNGFVADTSGAFDSITQGKAFMFAQMGERGAALAGGSRPAAWAYLRNALAEARAFRPGRKRDAHTLLSDADAAALQLVADGRMLFLVHVERASDLMNLVRLHQAQPQLRLVAVGASEGWMVAGALARANIPAIIEPQDNLPASFETLGATMENAARLHKAGVRIAIAQINEGFNARLAPQQAGDAVPYGLPWDAAFKAITLEPAKIFGLDDRLGALKKGMVADVVVWNGDPLELMTGAEHVFINGHEQSLTSRQTRLRDRYMDLSNPKKKPFAYR